MNLLEQQQHLLHAQLPSFQRKLDWSRQIIEDAMSNMRNPYLALSGGVDSQVVLDLLWKAGHKLPILWGDDGADFPETLAFIRQLEGRYLLHGQAIRCLQPWRDWCEEMGAPELAEDPAALDAWMNPHAWSEMWESLKDASLHGYDGVFLGLLASESKTRHYALKGGRKTLYRVKSEGDMWHCCPLAAWTKQDVWAYVAMRKLPYNPIYDRLAEQGVELKYRRVAPLTCFRVLHYGSAVALKRGWPDLFNQLAQRFPMVRQYL